MNPHSLGMHDHDSIYDLDASNEHNDAQDEENGDHSPNTQAHKEAKPKGLETQMPNQLLGGIAAHKLNLEFPSRGEDLTDTLPKVNDETKTMGDDTKGTDTSLCPTIPRTTPKTAKLGSFLSFPPLQCQSTLPGPWTNSSCKCNSNKCSSNNCSKCTWFECSKSQYSWSKCSWSKCSWSKCSQSKCNWSKCTQSK